MVKPISPKEVIVEKYIPDFVFKAFNNKLKEKINNKTKQATITQDEVIEEILAISKRTITSNELFSKNFLDVEPYYEEVGWEVYYHQPEPNQSFKPYFVFKAKK